MTSIIKKLFGTLLEKPWEESQALIDNKHEGKTFGVTNQIDFIIEDNKLKHNKFIPGVNIPIYSKSKLSDSNCIILVLAWKKYILNNKWLFP